MKKWLAAGMSAALVLGFLSGCGSSSAASTATASPSPSPSPSTTEAAGPQQQQDDNTVRGTVTSIDGDTITIQTMGGRMGGGPDGQMPGGGDASGASQDGKALPSGTPETSAAPSETPADTQTDAVPSGSDAPDGQGQPSGGQQGQAGEEITITLSDGTAISISENGTTSGGTASDITVGCMVSVTYGDDGETVTGITVMEMSGEGPQASQNGQASSGGQASDAPEATQQS